MAHPQPCEEACNQACNELCGQACNERCGAFWLEVIRLVVLAALASLALLVLFVGLIVGVLLELFGLRCVLQLLLCLLGGSMALKQLRSACSGRWRPQSAPLRALLRQLGACGCVATWGLRQLGARLPCWALAALCWLASCGLALRGSARGAYGLIVAAVVMSLAGLLAGGRSRARPWGTGGTLGQPLLEPEVPVIPVAQLWENFFAACRCTSAELFERGPKGGRQWLTRTELLELSPQVLVGLPALVLLRTALRGAIAGDGQGEALVLCSGELLTRASVPSAAAAQEAFDWMLEAQAALRGAAVRFDDLPVLDGLALWEGDLQGSAALSVGDQVSSRTELSARRHLLFSAKVPAGAEGTVRELLAGGQALVQWPQGSGPAAAPQLLRMASDRPKPLEALPAPDVEARLPKLKLAAGRARAVALTLSAMPMFAANFQKAVLEPLLAGACAPAPMPELVRTETGGMSWHNNALDGLAFGLAVEIGRARAWPRQVSA